MSITGNWDRRISRQTFLGISGMSAAALVLGAQGVWLPRRGLAQTTTDSNPFKPLGVASGDPLLNSVVLWTRLAPDPLNGGGMPDGEVTVDWEVASDSSFSDASRVRSGQYTAKPDLAHSVHVDAGEGTGDTLKPATTYYYRFEVDKKSDGTYAYTSPTGRTKTAPDPNASSVSRMKFAFVSCQHWESDLYPTYGHIAAQPDLDLVVHLGDYIYEGAPSSGKVTRKNPDGTYSYHSAVADPSFGCTTLADYRNRHAQYKTDQNLQAAHAAHPWAVTWDDHEVENDYAGTNSWYSRAILPRGGLPPTRPTTSTGTGPGTGTRKPGTATLPPVTASSNTSRITRCPTPSFSAATCTVAGPPTSKLTSTTAPTRTSSVPNSQVPRSALVFRAVGMLPTGRLLHITSTSRCTTVVRVATYSAPSTRAIGRRIIFWRTRSVIPTPR